MELQRHDVESLLQATDCREFLRLYLEKQAVGGPTSYAAFSRRAGIASRGYTRDVILGKRPVSSKALPKFVRGMELRGPLRQYFELLVARDESNFFDTEKEKIQRKLDQLRRKILLRAQRKVVVRDLKTASALFAIDTIPLVYAALGELHIGSTLEEIKSRIHSKIDPLPALRTMITQGIVEEGNGKFVAKEFHLSNIGIGESELFRKFFDSALLRTRSAAQKSGSPEALFQHSALCVRKDKLPALKEALRETILKFVDSTEDSNGDCVIEIVAALFPNRATESNQ